MKNLILKAGDFGVSMIREIEPFCAVIGGYEFDWIVKGSANDVQQVFIDEVVADKVYRLDVYEGDQKEHIILKMVEEEAIEAAQNKICEMQKAWFDKANYRNSLISV